MPDLTTLAAVKRYLGPQTEATTAADAILADLIREASEWVRSDVGRPLLSELVTEVRDGDGRCVLFLDKVPASQDAPPVSVTSITVDGATIPARPAVTALNTNPSGWVYRDGAVELVGYTFTAGVRNVTIVYRVGYQATQSAAIPGTPFQVQAAETWRDDVGVTISGAAAAKVASSPAAGQYAVSASGLYTFAAADTGKATVLTFAICPADLEAAVKELVAFKHRRRANLGQAAESAGGESASFSDVGVLAGIEDAVSRYRAIGVG